MLVLRNSCTDLLTCTCLNIYIIFSSFLRKFTIAKIATVWILAMLALLALIADRAVAAEVRNSVPTGPSILAGHTLQPQSYHITWFPVMTELKPVLIF